MTSRALAFSKRAVPTLPIATGEDHHGRHAFRELVARRCVDILQPDLRWFGGLSEAVKVYTIGEACGPSQHSHTAAQRLPSDNTFTSLFRKRSLPNTGWAPIPACPLAEAMRIPGVPSTNRWQGDTLGCALDWGLN